MLMDGIVIKDEPVKVWVWAVNGEPEGGMFCHPQYGGGPHHPMPAGMKAEYPATRDRR